MRLLPQMVRYTRTAPELGPVADTAALYEAVNRMRIVPLGKSALLSLAIPIAIQIPIKQILLTLLKTVARGSAVGRSRLPGPMRAPADARQCWRAKIAERKAREPCREAPAETSQATPGGTSPANPAARFQEAPAETFRADRAEGSRANRGEESPAALAGTSDPCPVGTSAANLEEAFWAIRADSSPATGGARCQAVRAAASRAD